MTRYGFEVTNREVPNRFSARKNHFVSLENKRPASANFLFIVLRSDNFV